MVNLCKLVQELNTICTFNNLESKFYIYPRGIDLIYQYLKVSSGCRKHLPLLNPTMIKELLDAPG